MSSIIFYGAGQNARENFERWFESGLTPVCFADSNRAKHNTFFEVSEKRIEILPLLEAISRYPDYELYLTQQNVATLYSVRNYLFNIGIPIERIKFCDHENLSESNAAQSFNTLYPELHRIYDALQDDLSRALFFARLNYSLTHNLTEMYRAMTRDDHLKWFSGKKTFASQLYGLNDLCQLFKENYPEQKNDIYLLAFDNDWNEYNWVVERFLKAMPELGITIKGCVMPYSDLNVKEFMGIPCLAEVDFFNTLDENSRIIIGFPGWSAQNKDIIERYSNYKHVLFPIADTGLPTYFESAFFSFSKNEVFVDVGVFDLTTSIEFAKWTNNSYEKIYAFEPAPNSYRFSLSKLNEMDETFKSKIELVNKGLSAKNGVLEFPAEYSGSGKYDSSNTVNVEVVTLDSYLNGKPVTFVKMDVEGAEMDVLLGMQETIKNHKPKLAVCIYHKHEDIYVITSYLLNLVPEYKFYIRHYNTNETETVLFCKV